MGSLPTLTHEYVLVNPPLKPQERISVAEYVLARIKQYGNSKAMVNSLTDETLTYNEIIRESIAVAAALKARGVKPGDVIAISSENKLEYAPVILGILAIGASCATLNPVYNTDELLHTLSIAKPIIIFSSPFTVSKIDGIRSSVSSIKEVIILSRSERNAKFASYGDLLKTPVNVETFQFPQIDPEESVAFLLCSSGTTGMPKCVELTHLNYMCLMSFAGEIWGKQLPGEKRVTLGLLPFFHGYGSCIVMLSLSNQICNVVMPRFEEQNFLNSIQKYRITHLFLVPPLVVFLSKHPLVSKYDLSSVRSITCGAAPLSRQTENAVQKRLNLNLGIRQGYGMTELSICCVAFQTELTKTGSSGTIAPGMQCKIVDLETGKALPPYERGEICFKGPFIMKGYRNNPKATAETFDADGWFHTGDIGYYDNEGFLFIVDRLKELIKYKGFQVPPAELETLLLNHPSVKEAGVIGIPDEVAGELPLAFVVKQPGAKIAEEEIKKFVAGKVSPQKRLHGGVRFINEIPKNPSGKILRRELRSLLNKSKL